MVSKIQKHSADGVKINHHDESSNVAQKKKTLLVMIV